VAVAVGLKGATVAVAVGLKGATGKTTSADCNTLDSPFDRPKGKLEAWGLKLIAPRGFRLVLSKESIGVHKRTLCPTI
jgi:hypothetical protein